MRNRLLPFLLVSVAVRAWTQTPPVPAAATNTVASTRENLSSTAVDPETRDLKPGDTLSYLIEEDPARTSARSGGTMQVRVSDGGEAIFPVTQGSQMYVKVGVRGKKIGELRREVKQLLDADYYENATVRLELTAINRTGAGMEGFGKVMVYGEMQGVVQLPEGETKHLSDAIISLGKSQFANLKAVRLHRLDPATGKTEIKVINVDKILRDGDRSNDVVLQDGDRIEVRPRTFNF